MLVSIVTPTTHNREPFNNQLREMVAAQTYENIEHLFDYSPATIGAKLNALCKEAAGEIIIRMDSDDLYSPDYVSICVAQLATANMTGLDRAYFTDGARAWLYQYKGSQQYVCGSGSAFHKKVWERNPFKPISQGEDCIFCAGAGKIIPHGGIDHFVARVHYNSTASHIQVQKMKAVSIDSLPLIALNYPMPVPAR